MSTFAAPAHAAGSKATATTPAAASAENCEPAGASHLAYSTNLDTDYNSVSVINTTTEKVVRYLPGFDVPANVTPVADGSKLYVDNWQTPDPAGTADTDVVNPCTGKIIKEIPRPGGLFPLTNLSADGKYVYLSAVQGFTVEQISTKTDDVTKTISTLITGQPIGYAVSSPDGKTLWVAGLHDVFTFNLATGALIGSPIPVGISPEWLGFTPDGTRLIATNFAGGTDSIINTATRKVISTLNIGLQSYPNSASATPNSKQFWVGNLDGSVTVINAQSGALVTTLHPGKFTLDVTFSPDGSKAYADTIPSSENAPDPNGAVTAFGLIVPGVYHPGPGEIAVYNTKTYALENTFPTGGIPSPVVTPPGPFTKAG